MDCENIKERVQNNQILDICQQADKLASQENYEEAVNLLSLALDISPFNETLRQIRGRKYIGYRKFTESIADLKLSVSLVCDNWENRYYLAVAYYLSGQYELARQQHWQSYQLMKEAGIEATAAAVDWMWMSSMKLGDESAATEVLKLVDINTPSEDGDYLARVLLYKQVYTADDFVNRHMCIGLSPQRTEIYRLMLMLGLANYYRYIAKNEAAAQQLLQDILKSETHHNLFAYMQAEQDANR